jgi:hypothetical protein
MIQRRAKRTLTAATTLVGLMLLVPSSSTGETLDPSLCAPDRNSFTLEINNEFLPLAPVGRSWVLRGEDEGRTVGLRITVLNDTEPFLFSGGTMVTTRVVEELEWVDTNVNGVFDDGRTSLRSRSPATTSRRPTLPAPSAISARMWTSMRTATL